jgi:hypothetical protein
MAAAKRKLSVPTLEERAEALMDELDLALDQLAEERRQPSVPRGSVRMMIEARGFGTCLCKSYLIAVKGRN